MPPLAFPLIFPCWVYAKVNNGIFFKVLLGVKTILTCRKIIYIFDRTVVCSVEGFLLWVQLSAGELSYTGGETSAVIAESFALIDATAARWFHKHKIFWFHLFTTRDYGDVSSILVCQWSRQQQPCKAPHSGVCVRECAFVCSAVQLR